MPACRSTVAGPCGRAMATIEQRQGGDETQPERQIAEQREALADRKRPSAHGDGCDRPGA